jgi:hypothetical protein
MLNRFCRRIVLGSAVTALMLFAALASAAPTQVPEVSNLTAQPARFCAKSCSNPGTTLHFKISTAATVTANMWPRSRNIAGYFEFRRHFHAGANSTRLTDNRLTPGRWTVKLQGVNAVGSGTTAITDVRVVK